MQLLARGCPKLRHFIAQSRTVITNEAVMHLSTYCPQLEVVNYKFAGVCFVFHLICEFFTSEELFVT